MKKNYLFLLFSVLLTMPLLAQDNVAPLSTVTANPGCSTGPCESLINGNYGSCGAQQMWISGGNQAGQWIEFRWTDAYYFAGMKIWHASNTTRFLCGFLLQRWDGTNWVTHQTFSNIPLNCESDLVFDTPFSGDRLRIFNFTHCGGQTSNANFREIEIYAFAADAEAISVSLQTNRVCVMGEYPVSVRIRNNGPGVVGPVDIKVEMEGAVGFTESINMSNVAEGTIGTFTLQNTLRPSRVGTSALKMTIVTVDTDESNNEVGGSANVVSTPAGSEIKPLGVFPGFPRQGTFFEKDIITYGKRFTYEITSPDKYSNNQHNVTWTSNFTITKNGSPLPGSRYTYVAPSGSTNARVDLDLTDDEEEADIVMNFRVLDVAGNGCDTVATRYIYVAPMPKPSFDGLQVCLGNGLQFQNRSTINSGGMSYVWDFGDGSGPNTQFEPNYKYAALGNYDVKLIATSTIGFVDSVITTISVNPTPVPDFEFLNQCGSQPIVFTNKSVINSGNMFFDWNFGNGQSSSEENPTITYEQAGPYDVTLMIESENGCFATLTKSAYSYPQPNVDFATPAQVCVGSELQLQNNTTIQFSNWGSEWSMPDGSRTFSRNPNYIFKQAGTSPVKLKVTTQFGCVDSMFKEVSVVPGPFIQLSHSDACVNAPVIFNSNVDVPAGMHVDYIWNINGEIIGDASPIYTFDAPGVKNISVQIAYANGCNGSAQMSLPAGFRPNVDFSLGDAICSGVEVALENRTKSQFGLPQYTWHMGDGKIYADFAPKHIYDVNEPTPVQVMLIARAQNGACPDTMVKNLTVGVIPSCDFEIEETYVPGHRAFKFVPNHSGASYRWIYGDGTVGTGQEPIHQFKRDGMFNVKLQVTTPEGCSCEKESLLTVANLSNNHLSFENGLKVYPNPSNGQFTIELEGLEVIQTVKVYNAVGEMVYQGNSSQVALDAAAAGVYLVKIETLNGHLLNRRIVISK